MPQLSASRWSACGPVQLAGLIGRGIGKSRSPSIHEGEARAQGMALSYRLIDFEQTGWADEELPRVVQTLAALGYSGANVTFPFKQAVIGLCNRLGEAAGVLGAVNTLVFRDGQIIGENTDWIGFSWQIERDIGPISGAHVAQIGAGGAGSATAYAMARAGVVRLSMFDPDETRTQDLCARLAPHFPNCEFRIAASPEAAMASANGVVNATPVGMASLPGLPFDPKLMTAAQWLADIIYFPLETELLAAGLGNGQRVSNGLSMVVGQAAEAFHLITGAKADRGRMLAELLADIGPSTGAPIG